MLRRNCIAGKSPLGPRRAAAEVRRAAQTLQRRLANAEALYAFVVEPGAPAT